MSQPVESITINNVEYRLNDLSDAAKQQIANLRVTDQEIERLRRQLAIAQTARAAYSKALRESLPKAEH